MRFKGKKRDESCLVIHRKSYVLFLILPVLLLIFSPLFRGIGAVVYRVPELGNDQLLKISLRGVDGEDTTPISEVVFSFAFLLRITCILIITIGRAEIHYSLTHSLFLLYNSCFRSLEVVGIEMPVPSC